MDTWTKSKSVRREQKQKQEDIYWKKQKFYPQNKDKRTLRFHGKKSNRKQEGLVTSQVSLVDRMSTVRRIKDSPSLWHKAWRKEGGVRAKKEDRENLYGYRLLTGE
jgi:hypothetical protein